MATPEIIKFNGELELNPVFLVLVGELIRFSIGAAGQVNVGSNVHNELG